MPTTLRLALVVLALVVSACAAPPPEVEEAPCAPHGALHNHGSVDECDCDSGYVADGLRCVERPIEPGEGEGEGVGGCGAHGEDHGGHCHCDVGYVEVDGVCVVPPACVGPDDDHEPNDSPEAATAFEAVDGALHACPVDEDWFRIEAAAGEAITIDVAFAHDIGDLDVYAWAAGVAGEAIYTVDPVALGVSEDDDERLSFVSTGGAHLFVVVGFAIAEAPYTVAVTRAAP